MAGRKDKQVVTTRRVLPAPVSVTEEYLAAILEELQKLNAGKQGEKS